MKHLKVSGLLIILMFVGSLGCGTKTTTTPTTNQCLGTLLQGVVHDSLTGASIPEAKVLLEAGSQLGTTPVYNFAVTATSSTDAQGKYSVCLNVATVPVVLVFESFDAGGLAYAPTIVLASQASVTNIVLLGSCSVKCALATQAQSSLPVSISGIVSTSPVSESGTITAGTAILALDGSKNIWNIGIEGLSPAQSDHFQSIATACPAPAAPCANYTFTLPALAPETQVAGVYTQIQTAPTYSISATPTAGAGCLQPSLTTFAQSVGSLPLTGVPGGQLTAASLSFTGCH